MYRLYSRNSTKNRISKDFANIFIHNLIFIKYVKEHFLVVTSVNLNFISQACCKKSQ